VKDEEPRENSEIEQKYATHAYRFRQKAIPGVLKGFLFMFCLFLLEGMELSAPGSPSAAF
jgi:hypothetical protein